MKRQYKFFIHVMVPCMIILLIAFTVRRSACLFTNIRDSPKPRQNLIRKSLDTHLKKHTRKLIKNFFAFIPIELFMIAYLLSVHLTWVSLLLNNKYKSFHIAHDHFLRQKLFCWYQNIWPSLELAIIRGIVFHKLILFPFRIYWKQNKILKKKA